MKTKKRPTEGYDPSANTTEIAASDRRRAQIVAFEAVRKNHPHYKAAFNRVVAIAQRCNAGKIVIVTGPSGVGKSTLAHSLLVKLNLLAAPLLAANPSLVPAVLVDAIAPHASEFNWKDFHIRLSQALHEPLIHKKLTVPDQVDLWKDVQILTQVDSRSGDALRRHTEAALRKRGTKTLIIDEANHILLCRSEKSLRHQFETIKSLADITGATIVLVGTYDLLKIRDLSAQLIRRGQIVHFAKYDFNNKDDRVAYKSVLEMFAKELPIPLEGALRDDVKFFYLKTAGCVGILRDLLRDSLADALESRSLQITRETVERNAQPNKAIRNILFEAAKGEVSLADIPLNDISDLVAKSPQDVVNAVHEAEAEVEVKARVKGSATETPSLPTCSIGRGKTGERRPQRDTVPVG
jgi:hypothetical protein